MEVNGLVEKQNLRILPLALHLQNNWRSRIGDEDPDGRRLNAKQRIKQKFVSTKITKIIPLITGTLAYAQVCDSLFNQVQNILSKIVDRRFVGATFYTAYVDTDNVKSADCCVTHVL